MLEKIILNDEILLQGVRLYSRQAGFDEAYRNYVIDRRQVWGNLDRITEHEIRTVVVEFLKAWKIRNVGRINCRQLTEVLHELHNNFTVFHGKNLVDFDFNEEVNFGGQNIKVYEMIKEIFTRLDGVKGVGSTSVSKIMHAVIPELFMMWDDAIRNGYGYANNDIGYLKFLRQSQQILQTVLKNSTKSAEALCREAYSTMRKTPAKLLDEYNFMKFTKGKPELPPPINGL